MSDAQIARRKVRLPQEKITQAEINDVKSLLTTYDALRKLGWTIKDFKGLFRMFDFHSQVFSLEEILVEYETKMKVK